MWRVSLRAFDQTCSWGFWGWEGLLKVILKCMTSLRQKVTTGRLGWQTCCVRTDQGSERKKLKRPSQEDNYKLSASNTAVWNKSSKFKVQIQRSDDEVKLNTSKKSSALTGTARWVQLTQTFLTWRTHQSKFTSSLIQPELSCWLALHASYSTLKPFSLFSQ